MATTLTEAEKLSIGNILGVDYISLDAHLDFYASKYTTASDTAVRAELTRWTASGAKFVAIEPNTANYGAKIDPEKAKADIRKNLANLLFYKLPTSGNYLPRG
jgi:hypothetical protein